jgi:hypothetical protein
MYISGVFSLIIGIGTLVLTFGIFCRVYDKTWNLSLVKTRDEQYTVPMVDVNTGRASMPSTLPVKRISTLTKQISKKYERIRRVVAPIMAQEGMNPFLDDEDDDALPKKSKDDDESDEDDVKLEEDDVKLEEDGKDDNR